MQVRMSVARCCCSACSTPYETSFSDDYSSYTTGENLLTGGYGYFGNHATATENSSRMRALETAIALGEPLVYRQFKFDHKRHSSISFEADLPQASTTGGGIFILPTNSPLQADTGMKVFAGAYRCYYDIINNTDLGDTVTDGDTLKVVATVSSGYSSGSITWDLEWFLNGVSKHTHTGYAVNEAQFASGTYCTLNYGVNADGFYDNWALTVT